MGRIISNGTLSGNSNSASGILQIAVGNLAVNANDLLVMNQRINQAFPAKSSDHASINIPGIPIVGVKTTGQSTSSFLNWRKGAIVASDGSIYVLGAIAAGTYGDGLQVSKYTPAGLLIYTLTLDASANGPVSDAAIVQLSNGNFAVTWSSGVLQYVAVITPAGSIVLAKTSTGIIGSPGNNVYIPDILALSGGGFVVAGQLNNGGGISFIIYTNAGGITQALTAVAGGPTSGSGNYAKLAQMANGNIVIGIGCAGGGTKVLGFAIYSAAGAAKVAYTIVHGNATTLAQPPEISAIGNFFCLAWNDNTNASAYVYSNSGDTTAVLQGGPCSNANATPTQMQIRLVNDGAAFWFVFGTASGNKATVSYIPTTGTGFVTTATQAAFAGTGSNPSSDAAVDAGSMIIAQTGANNVNVFLIDQTSHILVPVDSFTGTTGHAIRQIIPTFDYSIVEVGEYEIAVQKYAPAVIVGTAQTAVAAGNAGALVLANEGPGAFPINSIFGTSGKPFSHGGGNRGVMFSNSVALAGVGNPRNIN